MDAKVHAQSFRQNANLLQTVTPSAPPAGHTARGTGRWLRGGSLRLRATTLEPWPSDPIPVCLSDLPWKLGKMLEQEHRAAGEPACDNAFAALRRLHTQLS